MDRRQFNTTLLAGSLAGMFASSANAQQTGAGPDRPVIGMLVYPGMILLDLAGPLTVFNIMQADIRLLARTQEPISTDVGISIAPTHLLEVTSPKFDVLFVPGGLKGTIDAMKDPATVELKIIPSPVIPTLVTDPAPVAPLVTNMVRTSVTAEMAVLVVTTLAMGMAPLVKPVVLEAGAQLLDGLR